MKFLTLGKKEFIDMFLLFSVLFLLFTSVNRSNECRELRAENDSLVQTIDENRKNYNDNLEYYKEYKDMYEDLSLDFNYLANEYRELQKESEQLKNIVPANYQFSKGELEEFLKCVQAEAGAYNYESQKIIAQVIMNRVSDPHFPNTVHEVIHQSGQFSVVSDGSMSTQIVTPETRGNILECLQLGKRIPSSVLYFYSEHLSESRWLSSLNVFDTVEGTVFCYAR